jgi:hypothetical protein
MISNDPCKTFQTWIVEVKPPVKFKLSQNYPNPFNSQTTIPFEIDTDDNIKLTIYDINGRVIKKLINRFTKEWKNEVIWIGDDDFGKQVSSGLYFYRIEAGEFLDVKKMVLIK